MAAGYDKALVDVYTWLHSDPKGLNSKDAKYRLIHSGRNKIEVKTGPAILSIILSQFRSFIVLIPAASSVIALLIGDIRDAAVIFFIVMLNAIVGIAQELGARRSIESLKRLYRQEAHAMRDGVVGDVPVEELVPGDVVMIKAGDRVPADLRIISSIALSVDESILTGESVPREKYACDLPLDTPMVSRANTLYMGTSVLDGEGAAIVVETGRNTGMGQIARLATAAQKPVTPLEKSLDLLGRDFGIGAVAASVIVFIVGMLRGQPLLAMFLAAISMAVATVPEGLAATITIALATGARRMAKRNAIVRSLPIVEALGSIDVICTDKTGTLTRNEAKLKEIATLDRGYTTLPARVMDDPVLSQLATIAGVCNDAIEERVAGHVRYHGNQVDVALYLFLSRFGLEKASFDRDFPRVCGMPFQASTKMMAVIAGKNGRRTLFVKGSPSVVLPRSSKKLTLHATEPMTENDRKTVDSANDGMAGEAMRVLAFAYRELGPGDCEDLLNSVTDLTFVGLTGFEDPPRENVHDAIKSCKEAGIDVIMLTGDQRLTAVAVAKRLDLFHPGDEVMTGEELDHTTDAGLMARADRIAVYARVLPEQKIRVVKALQSIGKVVAVTGDGVNDSPALKLADVGIAMGATGTEVAKESSDIVLQDDNFSTIVAMIHDGRAIYDNIRKFVKYLFTSNVGEVATILFGLMVGLPLPLLATQILWLNLITDGPPALALSVDTPELNIMERAPRRPGESIITRVTVIDMVLIGLAMSLCSLLVYYSQLSSGLDHARTMTFTMLVVLHTGNAFNCRSETRSALSDVLSNRYLLVAVVVSCILLLAMIYLPPLQQVFSTAPLTARDWAIVLLIAPVAVVLVEIRKWITRSFCLKML
ncbi:MAG TPA: cation-transporting P-type ATPase [Methanocella sp.]|nr:cation-transporting P-type ATPase [Methanocella sp.]